ncbi:MAG TPA: type IX secretion system plug protein domain-containing protein [Bacteroidia bacterium]|jgi:hypothetical protein|nr:type IX secretion system plug protein domain-containing protein [Bacteroidia bacterium]
MKRPIPCPVLYLLLTLLIVESQHLPAQNRKTTDSTDDYFDDHFLRYTDYTYSKNIHSVVLNNKAAELSSPFMRFGSDDQLKLSFDDLHASYQSYHYTVIHCNADWQPSDLLYSEYINGFDDNPINDYAYADALCRQHYIHFSLLFPNSSLQFLKSGNYLLKVYPESKPDEPVITRRFMIYDNDLNIEYGFRSGSSLSDALTRQGLNLDIKYPNTDVRLPSDLKVCVMQNDRWDNEHCGMQPTFMKDHEWVFESADEDLEFRGGSEFRNFDSKSLKYRSAHMSNLTVEEDLMHVYLTTDESRSRQRYVSDPDLNGNFLIKNQDGSNSDVDADYCYVHFFLSYPVPEPGVNVYVTGALTDWQTSRTNKMNYNKAKHGYECTLFLKQGYYNYEYVMLADGQSNVDETPIEGSHSETENSYTLLVYYRPPAQNYDKLIAIKKINSARN